MYSSLDTPKIEEWAEEGERLLNELANKTSTYAQRIGNSLNEQNGFMVKFYCLKLMGAIKKLDFEKVELSDGAK